MELDLWEGQFNLSSPILEQFTTSLSTEELQQLGLMEGDSSTCWGEDSTVTMGTVRTKNVLVFEKPSTLLFHLVLLLTDNEGE